MGGVNAARENNQMVAKQVKILENRLDQALVKFNQSLAQNKKLREDIDDLRRERVVFDSIYRKLEKELGEKKRQMANVIEISNNAYEHRDNYQLGNRRDRTSQQTGAGRVRGPDGRVGRILETELKPPAPPERARTATAGSLSQKAFLGRRARTGTGRTRAEEKSASRTSRRPSTASRRLRA